MRLTEGTLQRWRLVLDALRAQCHTPQDVEAWTRRALTSLQPEATYSMRMSMIRSALRGLVRHGHARRDEDGLYHGTRGQLELQPQELRIVDAIRSCQKAGDPPTIRNMARHAGIEQSTMTAHARVYRERQIVRVVGYAPGTSAYVYEVCNG